MAENIQWRFSKKRRTEAAVTRANVPQGGHQDGPVHAARPRVGLSAWGCIPSIVQSLGKIWLFALIYSTKKENTTAVLALHEQGVCKDVQTQHNINMPGLLDYYGNFSTL